MKNKASSKFSAVEIWLFHPITFNWCRTGLMAIGAFCLAQLSPVMVIAADTSSSQPLVPASTPSTLDTESPDAPAMRLDKDGKPMQAFLEKHQQFLKRGQTGPIGVLFIGDSITAGWASAGREVWQAHYAALDAANFGIGGDRTQSVLWRIANGELDGLSPKVVVLLIGVNNGVRPGVARGVKKVVEEVHSKLPKSKLLLLGIFPHGADPTTPPWIVKARAHIVEVNKELSALDDGKRTRFLDIGAKFLDAQGGISKEIMPDGLHPGAKGYQIWADAMQPLLDEMLKDGV